MQAFGGGRYKVDSAWIPSCDSSDYPEYQMSDAALKRAKALL
jgi:hypothetical protein